MEIIIRKAEIGTNHSILRKSTQLLGYADNIDIISRTQEDLTRSFINIREAAEAMGLVVTVEKTKYMKLGATIPSNNIATGGLEFESVQNFIYLGNNDITQEIKRRIITANRTLFGLSKILRSNLCDETPNLKST